MMGAVNGMCIYVRVACGNKKDTWTCVCEREQKRERHTHLGLQLLVAVARFCRPYQDSYVLS